MKKLKSKIRKVRLRDLGGLLNLLYQLSPSKKNSKVSRNKLLKILEKIIQDKNYCICIYEIKGKIVGTVTLLIQLNFSHRGRPYGHIENVVTDKKYRGKGIGKKMIEYLIDKARKRNCYKVILDCQKYNISFYQKCGLEATGEVEMRMDL